MASINSFDGEYHFLSNFYPSVIVWQDNHWQTVEHAFQAAKSLCPIHAENIRLARSPGIAKRLGRSLPPGVMREDWDAVKVGIMRDLCIHKFAQNNDLLEKLKLTGNYELVEGNTWGDTFWGVCRGVGENNLGKILMEIRDA